MSKEKKEWQKEMEEFVNNMSEQEVATFLRDTGYEFYSKLHYSFLGLKEVKDG